MAFTYDTKARVAPSTSDPVTTSFTCGASAKLLVVTLAYAYNASGRGGGAPTYNGVALIQAGQTWYTLDGTPEGCAEIWYLAAPPTGSSYTVNVPNPNGLSVELVVSSYNCAAGSTAVLLKANGKAVGGYGDSSPSCVITTTAVALIVAVVADGDDAWAPSARSGTSLYETDNGSWGSGHQYYIQTSAGSTTMSWTDGHVDDYGLCVAAFQEVTTARVLTSKANLYADLTPTKGVSASKANFYAEITPAKGVSVAKANFYVLVEGDAKVAQVAEEIVYTTDAAPVQVAQAAEEIVYTTDAAPIQVAQVAQEIVLADYVQAQVAQVATEAMIQPTSQQAQVAQVAHEVMVQPTSQVAQVAQVAYEVMITEYSQIQNAQSAFEVLVTGEPDIQAAQSAFEVLVLPTDSQIQVAQSAFEVLVENATTGQVAQVVTEVVIRAELGPTNADVAQLTTEVVLQNLPRVDVAQVIIEVIAQNIQRATVAHTATEVVIQNLLNARVSHTAIEVISQHNNTGRVSHTAVEVISQMREMGVVSHVATEIVIKNHNWVRVAHTATEIPITGPAGAPGDTMITQMKLSVLQQGGGIIRGSQVTRAAVIHQKKKDFWPMLVHMLKPKDLT